MTSIPCARAARADRRANRNRAAQPERASLYEDVTRRIIGELEEGRFPWVQPWGAVENGAPCLPCNAATARPYSGINILILWGAAITHGYRAQGWLTFRQALDAGGSVRKGERGTTIVYADRFVPRDSENRDADRAAHPLSGAAGEGEAARPVAFLKRFTVFNIAQIDGLPPDLLPDAVPLPDREIVPLAEAVIAASGVDFRIGGNRACYAPGPDVVQVPPQPAFFVPVNYYRTALHELTHATGHASRLARDLTNRLGSKGYAREELIAELGSAFLCAALGIVPTVRHADYLASWLDVLREDLSEDAAVRGTGAPRVCAIFRAASAASKAADWLLARHRAAGGEALAQGPAATAPQPVYPS
ncbi:ArdC family protein [Sphingomonas sp.]|uniref:ArdC family protein n=1 Tax=Sphingomonas sp. TaxID=28214 RepID=UPI003D6D06BB